MDYEENRYIYEWDPTAKRWTVEAFMLEKRTAFGISVVDLDSEIFQHCETGNRGTDMSTNNTVATLSKEIIDQIVSIFIE